jgi:NADH dehydrogenase
LIAVSGRELAESALSDFALKLDIPLLNWFIEKLVLPYNGVQLVMQGLIIVAEILIGLSLISGLFTTPSSAFSLVLLFMFACTTGLYFSSFWMVFAAIALLIGAGRIFGLDYYAMPFLKKKWKNLRFVRKLYIYND